MLDHLFLSYGSIIDVELEHNWENMRKAWEPQQPVEPSVFRIALSRQKQGGVTISEAQKLQTVYANIFATGIFHIACRRWNDRLPAEQTCNLF
jgi:hypothetical protein